jgi:hypothetical protein
MVFSGTALPRSACDGMMDQLPGQKCREIGNVNKRTPAENRVIGGPEFKLIT